MKANNQNEKVLPKEPHREDAKLKAGKYEQPRIVTHSGEELDRMAIRVNACTSYIP